MGMRDWMNIVNNSLVESLLTESVDFHPAVKREEEGRTIIDYPEGSLTRGEHPCQFCDGTGKDEYEPEYGCTFCEGKGTTLRTVASCPEMNVSNRNAAIVASLMGMEDEEGSGWIEPGLLPNIRRRLIKLKNGDIDAFTMDTTVSQSTHVDHSGEVPRIARGPKMFDMGVPPEQIDHYIDQLLVIIDWAQKNGCGVSWA